MVRDPVTDAAELVRHRYPLAQWSVVSGSVVTPWRTAGSDLDIIVRLPDNDPQAPHRDSCRFRGWPVEFFVHDAASLEHYLAKELPHRRPVMHRMLASGVTLGVDNDELNSMRRQATRVLLAGPLPLSATERDRLRYTLTDFVDDLTSCQDPAEADVLAHIMWLATARAILEVRRHWQGNGKWLLRELRHCDPAMAHRWLTVRGDHAELTRLVREICDEAGGPLFEGHRVAGERPLKTD